MTLPTSGMINMSQVDVELGNSATTLLTLNDTPVRSLFQKPAGVISLSDGYSKSKGGVYNTLNPLDKYSNVTLSNGNLTASITSQGMVRSVQSFADFTQRYFEVYVVSGLCSVGIANSYESLANYVGQGLNSAGVRSDGSELYQPDFNTLNQYSLVGGPGHTIGIGGATDGTFAQGGGYMQGFIDGQYLGGIAGVPPDRWGFTYAAVSAWNGPCVVTVNFGATPWTYFTPGTRGWYI